MRVANQFTPNLGEGQDAQSPNKSRLYWKQEMIQKDESLAKLMQDNVAKE